MSSRKYVFSNEKKKKRAQVDELIQSQRWSIHVFLIVISSTSKYPNELTFNMYELFRMNIAFAYETKCLSETFYKRNIDG